MRLFFASWPPPAVSRSLAGWACEAQRDCGGRATSEDTIHLTLAFLGETDAQGAIATGRAVRTRTTSLQIEVARYWNHNRIVWAGPVQIPMELAALARALGETREFTGHVTLLRKARPPAQLPALPPLEWPVREFLLVNSELRPEGPRYEVLERFPLG